MVKGRGPPDPARALASSGPLDLVPASLDPDRHGEREERRERRAPIGRKGGAAASGRREERLRGWGSGRVWGRRAVLYRSRGEFGLLDLKIDVPCSSWVWGPGVRGSRWQVGSWVRGRRGACVQGGLGAWESLGGGSGAFAAKSFCLSYTFNKAHDKSFLPDLSCASARQTIFLQFCKIYKNYQINLKKSEN